MLVCIFNSIRSKYLDRMLQTSMFLMFSSRHVKGGYLDTNLWRLLLGEALRPQLLTSSSEWRMCIGSRTCSGERSQASMCVNIHVQ